MAETTRDLNEEQSTQTIGRTEDMQLSKRANSYTEELLKIIRETENEDELREKLDEYHDNDIATAFEELSDAERIRMYTVLGDKWTSDVIQFYDRPNEYLREIGLEWTARIISFMDPDDAADTIEDLDEEEIDQIIAFMPPDSGREVRTILSYSEDEIGSMMSKDYIEIESTMTIKQAMSALVRQAGENDNVLTIYVVDEKGCYYGAIELQDLITARENTPLDDIVITTYPYVGDHELISDCINWLKEYDEDSIPVVSDDRRIQGVITTRDILEAVDDELGDDYAKLAGLTEEDDLNETLKASMKKRMPWLILLLFLGMVVSSVVGGFETVVAVLPIVICFQSLVLDMSGNVGTQSLAVTIRAISDGELKKGTRGKLIIKEMRVGFFNGLFLGTVAFAFIGIYIMLFKDYAPMDAFMISLCVGISLMLAMVISSLTGTLIPMFFDHFHV
ncbi:MAG: magnesium transporter, partial [Firmicutes bacterium]|nr:magnesium transporter [Bacillota bacterium]